ncbi:RRP44A [Symbiodinium sp. KB8]|nr:RRP44A [Symbiodinium sp. KB8]
MGSVIEDALATEADITDDVPTSSRQLSSWLRRTRQNKIRKVVREVYLRDDIVPEPFEGADQVLVLDTNIVLHQIDLIAEDECVNHVVVPYTVLQEVRHRNMGIYARLRALCRVETGDAKQDQAVEAELNEEPAPPSNARRGVGDREKAKEMASARNARQFYVFPNEFFRETYVERAPQESQNDRNDRAIRRVAHWYRRHIVGPEVLLLTDDRACKAKAVSDGLVAFRAAEFVERMRGKFPEAGEKLALRDDEDEGPAPAAAAASAAQGRGVKRSREPLVKSTDGSVYPAHLKASEVERGLKERRLFQGVLRMHMNTCMHGTVTCGGTEEMEVSGRLALNRAIDGDVVVVEKVESAEVLERADKRLRLEVADPDFGVSGSAPSAADEIKEMQAQKAQETGPQTSSDRPKGRVVGILKRNWREYCGTLRPLHAERQQEHGPGTYNKSDRVFIPADARLPNIMIQTRHSVNLDNKRIVVVLDGWDRFSHHPSGHWTKILGDVGDRSVESMVILHEHGVITREFSEAVYRCLPAADWQPGKDIDDAVSCEPLPNGNYRVGVHIADVTHFVHPGTAIDNEAAERCTTVYLVERRTDMLPGLLTTDICSLRAQVERLTFSVLWEMTPEAEVVDTKFCKAIIKSRAALSYAEAQGRIDDPKDNSEITRILRTLLKLTRQIRARRVENGALELASQEVRFELDSETQDPTDVAEYQQRETNKLIEELQVFWKDARGGRSGRPDLLAMEALHSALKQGAIHVGVVLFDDYEMLDVYGPLELLAGCSVLPSGPSRGKVKLSFVSSETSGAVRPKDGPLTLTDMNINETDCKFDVLFIPGGMGTRRLSKNAEFLAKLGRLSEKASLVMTVCTGSLLLAATGLLDGKSATTNKMAFEEIQRSHPKVEWKRSARWCVDGKFYTSSGVAAGIDLTHFFVEELFGAKVAKQTSKLAEYVHQSDPENDPFTSVAPSTPQSNPFGRTLSLVLVVYDQFEMLDTFGPLEMFAMANKILEAAGQVPAFKLTLVSEDKRTSSFGGPVFESDVVVSKGASSELSFEGPLPEEIDLLLLPGGIGTLREVHNPLFQKAITHLVGKSQRVMTVCTGSAILASQGLLDGIKATTNKIAFDLMARFGPSARWVPEARWVADGKFWTSSGVSAGTDLSLVIIRELLGRETAIQAATRAEYLWQPDDDGSRDPFTGCIPKQTFGQRLLTGVQKAVMQFVFCFGFALGCKMQITRSWGNIGDWAHLISGKRPDAVATKILNSFPMFGVLRRHPPPKDDQLKVLQRLLAKNGIHDFNFGSNKELSDSLQKAVKAEDPFFNTLVRIMTTRCMNQAVYFCTGEVQPALYSHYGLAMERPLAPKELRYTHFTSPIRRYADVLAHRLLAASLGLIPLPEQLQSKATISEQCDKINVKHRMSQFASRASADLHTFMFFNKKGQQSAEAVVTRIRRSGMQVNVPRYGIEGVVAMSEEEWEVREEEQCILSKSQAGLRIDIFAHIKVNIESDNSDFRNRTHIRFDRVILDSEREQYATVEAARKQVQEEMFPDLMFDLIKVHTHANGELCEERELLAEDESLLKRLEELPQPRVGEAAGSLGRIRLRAQGLESWQRSELAVSWTLFFQKARNLSAGRPEMQAQVDGRAKWKTSENTPGTTPFPTCLLAY